MSENLIDSQLPFPFVLSVAERSSAKSKHAGVPFDFAPAMGRMPECRGAMEGWERPALRSGRTVVSKITCASRTRRPA